jgi:hypothetical protein
LFFFVAGISNCAEVETGIQHIIADVIAKDKEVMEEIRKMYILTFFYTSPQSSVHF